MVIEFPEQLRKTMEERYRQYGIEPGEPARFRGTVRVDAKLVGALRSEARSGGLTWVRDGRREVGGAGEYPGALQYFISGLPFCHMAHYSERGSVLGLRLESVEISVRAHYDTRPGGYFDEVEYETRILSPEPVEKVRELVGFAEGDCYVTNTLSRVCRIRGTILLNGRKIMETIHHRE